MTAGKVLRHSLVVRHPDTFEATALLAGEAVPSWAADLVADGDLESSAQEEKPAKKAAAKRSSSK